MSAKRTDREFIASQLALSTTKFIVFCQHLPHLFTGEQRFLELRFYSASQLAEFQNYFCGPLFCGQDEGGVSVFMISLVESDAPRFAEKFGGEFMPLRNNLMAIKEDWLGILTLGVSIFGWHLKHGFCSNCGAKSIETDAGWKRVCNSCNSEHFPRVDPVVIMLVLFENKCLLANSAQFPPTLYSILAGFVEPGETFEQACAREVMEEVGIEVEKCTILANQPWPNFSQLMVGMVGYAKSNKITIDPKEINHAIWLSKDEVRQLISKDGFEINGQISFGPRRVAIASYLLKHWLEGKV